MEPKNLRIDYEIHKTLSRELTPGIVAALDKFKAEDLYKTCITCAYFDAKEEKCMKVGVRPPAFIIVRGCEAYYNNSDIPF